MRICTTGTFAGTVSESIIFLKICDNVIYKVIPLFDLQINLYLFRRVILGCNQSLKKFQLIIVSCFAIFVVLLIELLFSIRLLYSFSPYHKSD